MTKGLMEHLSAKDEVLTLASVSSGSGVLHQEVVLDKEAFREELRTQKLKVAKLEEKTLEIPKIHQELRDSRTIVHANEGETHRFGTKLQNIKG